MSHLLPKHNKSSTENTSTKKEGNLSHIRTVTIDFFKAEWSDVGHISLASSVTATVVTVAHFVAPSEAIRTVARGFISNNQAL